jgi:hypothetical protein
MGGKIMIITNVYQTEAAYRLNPKITVTHEQELRTLDGSSIPSEEDINAEAINVKAEIHASQYQRDRKTAYDALNQLELISDDAINGTTTHADAITAIKAEFPKPV